MSEPPPTPTPSVPPSERRLGPYSVVDRLATGGMAEVFRAREPRAAGEPRTVVVKRMLPQIASQQGSRQMFEEEAKLASFVRHPNVIELFDLGEHDGQPYLALEYVPGVDLWRLSRKLTRDGTSLDVELAVFVVRELLNGLHAVHEACDHDGTPLGIVHRDVSPSNVLLSRHGDIKLGDFGIARRFQENYQHSLGGRKGKLGYLAPEQVMGHPVSRTADVFAAGVIAAELLMGRPLFTGGSELAVLLAIRDVKLSPFLEASKSLPPGLDDIIMAALARDPEQRTPTADALRQQLEPFQNEDELALRGRLGNLVREAMDEEHEPEAHTTLDVADPESADFATPLDGESAEPLARQTKARRDPESDRATPVRHVDEEPPITTDLPGFEYHVRTIGGAQQGPWSYASIVEAISTGELSSQDEVSVDGADYQELQQVPELARHLPASSLSSLNPPAPQQDVPPQPHDEVSMEDGGLVVALANTTLRRDTGLWLCEHDAIRKEIYVRDGAPEFVSSNLAEELLGEHLVRNGVISHTELDMALAVMPRFEGKLGDTLVGLELVDPLNLFQHLADQVRHKVLDLFTWKTGSASFYPGVPPPSSGFPLGLDPWQLLDEGLQRRLEAGLEGSRLDKHADDSLVVDPAVAAELSSHHPPAHVTKLCELATDPRSLQELSTALAEDQDPRRGQRAVLLLLYLDAIDSSA